jgi:fluoroacetyl-CoA thioesterase
MDFNALLKVGDTNINKYMVKLENTADFLENEGVTVLSTPSMIGFMEVTAAQIVTSKIPKNYRPVGTKIDIQHINSTPVNTEVTIKATLIALEGRRLRFDVEAFNEKCKIGFGKYEQHIVNLNEFLAKH